MSTLKHILVFSLILTISYSQDDDFLYDTFPDGFQWGTATSSYQIEGAWNVDGKGEQIWDKWCHEGGKVKNNDTGDVACDSYNKYNDDVAMLSNLGVNFYRFSLSWSRILPDGTMNNINQAGIDYYYNLIDALLAAGIQPMVTLYHWDLPQGLQDMGGWTNDEIIRYFSDYARLCFMRFGDRVKLWLTFNEPWVFNWLGHGVASFPPGINGPDVITYQVAHNIIKAHAEAWHIYDEEFRHGQQGKVSITLDMDWKEPLTNSTENLEAAERAMQFKLGWYANPIFVNGDYPEIMKSQVAMKSQMEGRNESRLPVFTLQEKMRIVGTHDFFGLNHYSSVLVENMDRGTEWPSWDYDRDVSEQYDPSWPTSGSEWLRVVPWGLRKLLVWIKDRYNNPEVYITENGVSDPPEEYGSLQDTFRQNFYRDYINNVLKAVKLDGCNVIGYTAWSLMDNFEWTDGYSSTFGIHQVNFTDPTRQRVPKGSVGFFQQLIADNGWPNPPAKKSFFKKL